MKGTKPTAGVPHHPVVTSVLYETTGKPSAEPAEKFAAMLQARTVGHLDAVNVGAIVSAWLADEVETHSQHASAVDGSDEDLGHAILRVTALVETVLDEARSTLDRRLSIDMAAILIPRLKGPRSV